MFKNHREWEISNRLDKKRRKAIGKVRQAVLSGKIIKPEKCSQCNDNKGRIEGHHPDYKKPLAIIWLCRFCHRKMHVEINRTKKQLTLAITELTKNS